jgi:hypothetical protein
MFIVHNSPLDIAKALEHKDSLCVLPHRHHHETTEEHLPKDTSCPLP